MIRYYKVVGYSIVYGGPRVYKEGLTLPEAIQYLSSMVPDSENKMICVGDVVNSPSNSAGHSFQYQILEDSLATFSENFTEDDIVKVSAHAFSWMDKGMLGSDNNLKDKIKFFLNI